MSHRLPWEAGENLRCHEISHILWNPQIRCCVCNNQPDYPTLSQTNSAHAVSHFFKIHFKVILPPTPNFQVAPSFYVFHRKLRVYWLIAFYVARPSHPHWPHEHLSKCNKSLGSSIHNFLHPPITSSSLGASVLLSTLFFKHALDQCSFLRMTDHVSHLYKITKLLRVSAFCGRLHFAYLDIQTT
jgi:hypothetical protein